MHHFITTLSLISTLFISVYYRHEHRDEQFQINKTETTVESWVHDFTLTFQGHDVMTFFDCKKIIDYSSGEGKMISGWSTNTAICKMSLNWYIVLGFELLRGFVASLRFLPYIVKFSEQVVNTTPRQDHDNSYKNNEHSRPIVNLREVFLAEYLGAAQIINVAYCRKSLPIIVWCKVCGPCCKDIWFEQQRGHDFYTLSKGGDDPTQTLPLEQEMQHTFWGEYSRPRIISPRLKYKVIYYSMSTCLNRWACAWIRVRINRIYEANFGLLVGPHNLFVSRADIGVRSYITNVGPSTIWTGDELCF